MNGTQAQAMPGGGLAPNQFDLLMSAIKASTSGQQAQQNGHGHGHGHGQFLHNLQQQMNGGDGGLSSNISNINSPNPPPPIETATSLDQIFGHSGFSRAISTAQSTPTNQLTTPFYEILLQNLLNTASTTSTSSAQGYHASSNAARSLSAAPPHIQQTRSGRISRPPVPPQMGQNDILRVLTLLNQPGMEPIRSAMDSAGLVEAYEHAAHQNQNQHSENGTGNGDPESRNKMIGQALRMLLASQNGTGGQTDPAAQFHEHGGDVRQNGQNGEPPRGKKRSKKDDPTIPVELPARPAPPRGKGSRLAMSKDEILWRRRERNKASALASRQKKKGELEDRSEALRLKEEEAEELARKCERLEREVEALRQVVLSAGLNLPIIPSRSASPDAANAEPEPTPEPIPITDSQLPIEAQPPIATIPIIDPTLPLFPTFPFNDLSLPYSYPSFPLVVNGNTNPSAPNPMLPPTVDYSYKNNGQGIGFSHSHTPASTTTGTMDTGAEPTFDFNMFMNMDNMDDEADDGDFEPETSPHHGSDTDGGDGDDMEGDGDEATPRAASKGKGKTKKTRNGSGQENVVVEGIGDGDGVGEGYGDIDLDVDLDLDLLNDEDFIDPEMEDEDLFLPIEDVPIPPESYSYSYQYQPHHHRDTTTEITLAGGTTGDVTGDMMKALKVDTRDQLAAVMQKLVDSAGEGEGLAGVAPEVVEKLKNVIMMAQTQAQVQAQAQGKSQGEEDGLSGSAKEGEKLGKRRR